MTTTESKKNDIRKTIKELVDTKELAEKNLEGCDVRTIQGFTAAKRDAQEKVLVLEKQYAKFLRGGLCAIFVNGTEEKVNAFLDAAAPQIAVDASKLYRRLADDVEPFMRTDRTFEPAQFGQLLQALSHLGRELNAQSVPLPQYRDGSVVCPDAASLADHIRSIVRESMGDELNAYVLFGDVFNKALSMRYYKERVPVIVVNATPEEQQGLAVHFNDQTISVTLDGEVDEKTVREAFSSLKQRLNNKQQ